MSSAKIGLVLLLFYTKVCAQSSITGVVKDSSNLGLSYVSITLKNQSDNIIAYTFSDENGNYRLDNIKIGEYSIQASALGYESLNITLAVTEESQLITQNFKLNTKTTDLEEVIIQAERPIRVKKDTVTFKAAAFSDGTEVTVEELLKKIPGLQIDSEGTIKVGNKEIEKLMVDGDDLFEKGYKILSKNMPAHPIDEIEVLKRYSNNHLLKGIEESDKVALNLKLNEDSKRIWFGNMEASYGNDHFYQLKANLMNFGKKNKYYFLTNLNNIGFDATGDINHLIRPFRTAQAGVIGDNENANKLLLLSGGIPGFRRSRYNFNNAELLSLNAIFNPTEQLKVKTLGFFNWDERDFFRNNSTTANANGTLFTNTENYRLRNNSNLGFGKLDLTYN
ncbi:MAG: carboxypeptidase-like regulatory domain-containing protein, partial [Flavobacteriaceae bacterium]|nr:carboxypeptidase-like regulatory domain-containing protein [Flavobacteriaceae bacterium]